MNEPNYTEILEEAKLGLLDKATILDHLEKAREILVNYEKQEADVQGNLDAANFELSNAGEDAKRHREICDLYGLPAELEETLREIQEMIGFYRNLINNLETELADYKNFDKKLCLKNIRDLLKDKPEVKIGQIEKDAGVSAGYMSRLEKPDNNAEPSMNFIGRKSVWNILQGLITFMMTVGMTTHFYPMTKRPRILMEHHFRLCLFRVSIQIQRSLLRLECITHRFRHHQIRCF